MLFTQKLRFAEKTIDPVSKLCRPELALADDGDRVYGSETLSQNLLSTTAGML